MELTFLTGILVIIATHIYVSDCNTELKHLKSPAERRQILLRNIVNKMNELSLNSFHNASLEDTPKMLKNIKNHLRSASTFTGSRGNTYVELLMDGIKSIVASRNKFGEIESANAIESNIQDSVNYELQNALNANDDSSNELEESSVSTDYGDEECDCSCVEERLCSNISALYTYTCHKDQNEISLANMCDGENDCVDKSDEKQCRKNANKKLSDTKRLINKIKNILPKLCLEVQNSVDKVIMKTRKETLNKVLKKQIEVLNTVAPIKLFEREGKGLKKVEEIVQIVSSVEAALEGALCIREKYKIVNSRRNGLTLDEGFDAQKKIWAPPVCTCSGEICIQNNCTSACNNTCWQRNSLGQWLCQAAIGRGRSVPLDLVCDGRIDCIDESDERGCTAGVGADKFKATQMYNSIMELLATKMPYTPQIEKKLKLQETVKKLQTQSIKDEINSAAIKNLRDKAFSGLRSIYDGVLTKANNILEADAGYKSLITVSQMLVEAMKLSKTGNKRFLPSYGCFCLFDKCLLTDCTAPCVRFCAVKAIITEYLCEGNSSKRIPVQFICNGDKDCPGGDDELKCATEVCRNHHLLVLRNQILNYKTDRWGYALSQILDSWKTKTMSSIRLIEETLRLTPQGLQKVVEETLHDLAQTYATIPRLMRRSADVPRLMRRNADVPRLMRRSADGDGTLPAFLQLSRLIQKTLRDCTI